MFHSLHKKFKIIDLYRDEIELTFDELIKLIKQKGHIYKLSDINYNWLYNRKQTLDAISRNEFTDILHKTPNKQDWSFITLDSRRHTYEDYTTKDYSFLPSTKYDLKNIKSTFSFQNKINRRQTFDGSTKFPSIT